MKLTWGIRNWIFFEKHKTLILGHCLGEMLICSNPWVFLSNWEPYEHAKYSWFLGQLSNWLGKVWNQDLKLGMDKLVSPKWSIFGLELRESKLYIMKFPLNGLWSKFSWLLVKKTLIWQLLTFDELRVFLMNHDQPSIK